VTLALPVLDRGQPDTKAEPVPFQSIVTFDAGVGHSIQVWQDEYGDVKISGVSTRGGKLRIAPAGDSELAVTVG
jgi:hypothetical protein